jgi:hypothetical protein
MSARTDALVSQAETGKISTASIFSVAAGCHPECAGDNAGSRRWFAKYTCGFMARSGKADIFQAASFCDAASAGNFLR